MRYECHYSPAGRAWQIMDRDTGGIVATVSHENDAIALMRQLEAKAEAPAKRERSFVSTREPSDAERLAAMRDDIALKVLVALILSGGAFPPGAAFADAHKFSMLAYLMADEMLKVRGA